MGVIAFKTRVLCPNFSTIRALTKVRSCIVYLSIRNLCYADDRVRMNSEIHFQYCDVLPVLQQCAGDGK